MIEQDPTLGALREPLESVLVAKGAAGTKHARQLAVFAGGFDTREARTSAAWEQEVRTILEKLIESLDGELKDEREKDTVRQVISAVKTILVMGRPNDQTAGLQIFEARVRGLGLSAAAQELLKRFLLMTSVQPTVEAKREAVLNLILQIQLAAQAVLDTQHSAVSDTRSTPLRSALVAARPASTLFRNAQVDALLGQGIQERQSTDAEIVRLLDRRSAERYIQRGDDTHSKLFLVQPDQQILFLSTNGAVLIKITRIERGRASFGGHHPPLPDVDAWRGDPEAARVRADTPTAGSSALALRLSSKDQPDFVGTRYHYTVDKIIQRPLG